MNGSERFTSFLPERQPAGRRDCRVRPAARSAEPSPFRRASPTGADGCGSMGSARSRYADPTGWAWTPTTTGWPAVQATA